MILQLQQWTFNNLIKERGQKQLYCNTKIKNKKLGLDSILLYWNQKTKKGSKEFTVKIQMLQMVYLMM